MDQEMLQKIAEDAYRDELEKIAKLSDKQKTGASIAAGSLTGATLLTGALLATAKGRAKMGKKLSAAIRGFHGKAPLENDATPMHYLEMGRMKRLRTQKNIRTGIHAGAIAGGVAGYKLSNKKD